MYRRAISSSILMDVSELRIEYMRWSGSENERQLVNRLFETPASYCQWEGYHAGLMRTVGSGGSRKGQLLTMRRLRFQLIHRQALFEFLRVSSVTGKQREALFGVLHGTQDYARAVVAEHGRYLQSNSSLYCADHLAYSIMRDLRFSSELERYRSSYLEYFGHHCNWILAESQGQEFSLQCLIPHLKQELQVLQRELLRLPAPIRLMAH